jgi:hypothetical protein
MTVARHSHTATLLNNGQVLIIGGWDPSPPFYALASAELYDPHTGRFTATSNITVGWFGATTTLLPDGKVLASSAYDARNREPGIVYGEVYDPVTRTFTQKGSSTYCCFYWQTASLLTNGTVLIAGGGDADVGWDLATAGIYDPRTGAFATTGNMTTHRYLHTATVLLDGTVLITGGQACCGPAIASAELYDASTGTFNYVGDMTKPRSGHTATLLNNGEVLIAGGWSRFPTASAELYVPPVWIPALVVTDLRFDRTSVVAGTSYSVNVSGYNLTPQTFFDVRFSAPGNTAYEVVLNWQKGIEASHSVPARTAPGSWTINGIRAHQDEADHTGSFVPVSAGITVSP